MTERGTTAVVYDNVFAPNVKNKALAANADREVVDHEVLMICAMRNKIGVPLLSYAYPHIEIQLMHETLTAFVARKRPPLEVLLPIFNQVARHCAIMYSDGIFHCDLMTNNVIFFYRTPTAAPLGFFIDHGISYKYREPHKVVHTKGAPRQPDADDGEYDFLFFMYSCLHCCWYLQAALMAHYEHLMVRMRRCFERYHNNGRNHQWYLVGTLCTHLCWKIGSLES